MSTRGVSLSLVQFPHSKWYQDADEVYVFIGDVTKQPVYHVEASASVKNRLQARDKALEKTFLRILHLNDLHGNIAALNRDGPSTNHFSNLYSHIKMRRESEMTDSQKGLLVFSGGDELGGSPLEQLWIETGVHAVYQLYNQIGLSAATLGNHDFDLGAEELARAITMYARFPILTANIIAEGELAACLFPAAIFNLDGLRVGVIGITLANRHKNASNYQITDPAAAVNHLLPALAEWSDVIVILSHAGYTLEGDIGLANAIPIGSADLIVGGHTHSEIAPNRGTGEHIVNGIPIVQAGSNAQVIGDCTFKILPQTGRARFQNETLVPTSDLEEDIKFSKAFVLPCVDLLQKMLRRPLGPQFFPDNGYLQADVERKFARTKLPLAALIADAIAEASRKEDQRIDFAIADRSVVQSGFSQVDQATLGDWLRIIPYVDQIATVSMTGHELLRFFEDNVGRRLEEGDVEQEKGYCYFSHEIKYKVKQNSPSAPARLKEVWISDLLLKDNLDRIFRCAFPSFFRQLAKEWESTVQRPLFNLRNLDIKLLNLFVRDAVYAYIGTLNSYPTFEH